ncbi:hypothetical protein [Auraticoccus monumenti]|uniref:ParB-like nuclease domain-containing protein n=1 Tax=Auraticoccus monumenti TaxID=675864 RepID=A0A1G6ZF67_9ACTN|nr:hypothetical protein [Auraticoccus monumenti]SDE00485.1 hypothetical protein SAMN04489747_2255 [Auraticoccus monumenti]
MSEVHSRLVDGERHWYRTRRLWELAADLPVHQVPLTDVAELDQDCWFEYSTPTIRKVAEHARRIRDVDPRHPIILAADGTLMDGGHRLARAWLEGRASVPAVRFETDPLPDAVGEDRPGPVSS